MNSQIDPRKNQPVVKRTFLYENVLMIRITLKGLAKFIMASPAKQRKILRDYKYPKDEGQAMAQYYQEARGVIKAYHKNTHEKDWLLEKAKMMRQSASATGGQSGRRLTNNARGIEQYAEHFSDRKFDILPDTEVSLANDQIKIKINPELHVLESGKDKIIKLEFAKEAPSDHLVKIVCQTMFEGALQKNGSVKAASVLYLDVPRGIEYRGAKQGSKMRSEIEAACKNIVSMWDSI